MKGPSKFPFSKGQSRGFRQKPAFPLELEESSYLLKGTILLLSGKMNALTLSLTFACSAVGMSLAPQSLFTNPTPPHRLPFPGNPRDFPSRFSLTALAVWNKLSLFTHKRLFLFLYCTCLSFSLGNTEEEEAMCRVWK